MATRNMTDGALVISDGTTPANTLTVPVMEGDLSFVETAEAPVIMNRGSLYGMATPLETPLEVSFTLKFEEWQGKAASGSDPSPVDALRQRGNAAAWAATISCGPYTVDLIFTVTKPCTAAGEESEVLTFADFHCDRLEFSEGEEYNTISCSGRCLLVSPTSVRS